MRILDKADSSTILPEKTYGEKGKMEKGLKIF